MNEPQILYSVNDIAKMLGVSRQWVHRRAQDNPAAPQPPFKTAAGGRNVMPLWLAVQLPQWRAFHASTTSVPNRDRYVSYSDHNAVNKVNNLTVTYKLWWRCTHDGGTMWWFSTPQGWWTSTDDGRTWQATGLQVRPADYHYYCVNSTGRPTTTMAAVLHSAAELRALSDDTSIDTLAGSA